MAEVVELARLRAPSCPRPGSRLRRRRRSRNSRRRGGDARCDRQTSSMSNGSSGIEDDVGATGETRVGRDPAGVPTHDLDHHHAVVALGRRVQAIDRVGRDLHCRVEPEREVGRREIVVDRLRDTHDLHAVGGRACARRRACPRRRSRSTRRPGRAASVAFTLRAPSSDLYGLVRDVPRIVPPRGSRPRTDATCRSIDSPCMTPRQPCR